ncbi:unnamed protein product [Aspergillus oryzae RIB40]|uniref:DNA, SC038 n=1 Tax=Aspergillus oryzae (strain ATCC 42149 / RIB 40) TaxID=510516 RepID=Q2U232_ASPOR|nr:unnamed protein product [Aspergillus oryzae RIB40]BAE64383.1 unnamed protein product [Aspergillus oryzae RIB40]
MKIASISAILLLPNAAIGIPRSDLAEDVVFVPKSHEPVYLEKRRGGGGGQGGGGSGGGSGGRGGSGGSSSRTGSSSNSGGSSRSGSGPQPAYGRGSYYAGGARSPYTSGALSPLGIAPIILPATALAFFGGTWLSYYESIFNGTQPANSSVAKIVEVNGTETIYINGTLPNGTTVADSSAPSDARTGIQTSGYWPMVALVASTIWGL